MPTGGLGASESRYGELIIGYGAETVAVVERDCENVFGWSQVTEVPTYRDCENVFGFVGDGSHNYVQEVCSNDFGFTDGIGYDWEEDLIQYLGFTTRQVEACQNTLSLSDTVNDVYFEDVTNVFILSEELVQTYAAANAFGWTQLVVGLRVEDCFNQFEWASEADSSGTTFGRGLSDSLFKQHLSYTITGARCADKEYAPLVGESGDDSYGEMPLTPPVLGSGTLTLTYPRVAPTTTLVLKNPAFGNTDTLQFTLLDVTTRGGDRILYGDPKWGTSQVFGVQLVNVCEPDIDDLVDFLNTSLGKEIGLADWEGRNWAGVIIAPNTQITFNAGGYRVQIQFQGELVE